MRRTEDNYSGCGTVNRSKMIIRLMVKLLSCHQHPASTEFDRACRRNNCSNEKFETLTSPLMVNKKCRNTAHVIATRWTPLWWVCWKIIQKVDWTVAFLLCTSISRYICFEQKLSQAIFILPWVHVEHKGLTQRHVSASSVQACCNLILKGKLRNAATIQIEKKNTVVVKTKGKATTINSTTTKPAEICQAFASTMVNQFLRWRHNSFLCLFIGFRNAFVEVEMILTMPDFWCKKVNKWRLGERWFFEKKKRRLDCAIWR